jgi:nuclear inhibitor of protein phosphatase 1
MDSGLVPSHPAVKHYIPRSTSVSLYDDLPNSYGSVSTPFFTTLSSKLDLPLPNPAPDIEPADEPHQPPQIKQPVPQPPLPPTDLSDEPKKKKYAKEAWPGKKQGNPNLLI